jgi:hypothetical protein
MSWDADIRDLVDRRVDYLRKKHRDLSITHFVLGGYFGEYGIILYTDYNFNPMAFEFIESRISWMRPDAINEYNELVDDGYCVIVYVPNDTKNEVSRTIREKKGKENIRLFSTDVLLPIIKP